MAERFGHQGQIEHFHAEAAILRRNSNTGHAEFDQLRPEVRIETDISINGRVYPGEVRMLAQDALQPITDLILLGSKGEIHGWFFQRRRDGSNVAVEFV